MFLLLLVPFVFGSTVDNTIIDKVDYMYQDTCVNEIGGERYFNVSLDLVFQDIDDTTPINIMILPLVGGLEVYAALMGATTMYPSEQYCTGAVGLCMSSTNYYFNTIRFNSSDPYFVIHAGDINLKITISYAPFSGAKTKVYYDEIPFYIYVSKMTVQHHWNEMTPNRPVVNECTNRLEFDFYQFSIDSAIDINAVVTPITSDVDPDVFLSSSTTTPTFSTPWYQRYVGISNVFDFITAIPGDQAYNCSTFPCDWGLSAVGIVSEAFYYSVFWEEKGKGDTLLYEGLEIGGVLNQGEYNYYTFYLPTEDPAETSNLVVTVFNVLDYGDPDIYLCYPIGKEYNASAPKCSWDNCDFCQGQTIGSDEVIVPNSEIGDQGNGWWRLSVYGYDDYSKYLVSFFKESSIIVNNNDPIQIMSQPNSQLYFRYVNMMEIYNIEFNVNCQDNTNLDMYLDYSEASDPNVPFPGPDHNKAVGTKVSDKIGIYYFKPQPNKRGNYFFSVWNSGTMEQNLTITVVTNQTHVILRDNRMLYYQVIYGDQFIYYIFEYDPNAYNLSSSTSFNFIVTPETNFGDVDMFISTTNHFPHDESTSEWQSENWMDDSITIFYDEGWDAPPLFYIGVKGNAWQEVNTFTIIGYITPDVTDLIIGDKPYTDEVAEGSYRHYRIFLRTDSSFQINLQKEDAEEVVKMYMIHEDEQHQYWPSVNRYTWMSTSYDVEEEIYLPRAVAGTYLLTIYGNYVVYGHTGAKFAVSATTNYGVLMIDNFAIEVLQSGGEVENIQVNIADQTRVLLSIPVIYGEIRVFICMDETMNCSTSLYDLMYHEFKSYAIVIDQADTPLFKNHQTWTILTQAVYHSNYIMSMDSFQQNMTTLETFGSDLTQGWPRFLDLRCDAGYYLKYNFMVDDDWWSSDTPAEEKWYINLRDVNGEVSVWVNQDWSVNPTDAYCEVANPCPITGRWGNDINAELAPPDLKKGFVFLTIANVHSLMDSKVMMTVYPEGANMPLLQDDEYISVIPGSDYRYFESWAVKSPGLQELDNEGMIQVDSCEEYYMAPIIYLNVQRKNMYDVDHHPSPSKFDQRSIGMKDVQGLGNVRQEVTIKEFEDPEMYYYLVENVIGADMVASIFVSDSNSSKPYIGEQSLMQFQNGIGIIDLFIPLGDPPIRFPDHYVSYSIYLKEFLDRDIIKGNVNFDTPCAVQKASSTTILTTFQNDGQFPLVGPPECVSSINRKCMQYTLKNGVDFSDVSVYKLGILAFDNLTRVSEAYNSIWIVDGVAWSNYDWNPNPPNPGPPDNNSSGGLSAFGTVMIVLCSLVCCCCVCYLCAGAIVVVVVLFIGLFSAGGATTGGVGAAGAFIKNLGKKSDAPGGYEGLDDYALDDKGTINKDLVPDSYGAL